MHALDATFVVVVDDDRTAIEDLRLALVGLGAQVAAAHTAANGVTAVDFHRPNAVVVDPEMEGGKGWDVARAASAHDLPLVVLDRTAGAIRRVALAGGADEVVAVPFDPNELALRTLGLVRRARPATRHATSLRHRDLTLDVATREVRVGGKTIALTSQQFEILRALLEADGATLSRAHLLARIAPIEDEPPSERAIDLHVKRLRQRLGDDRARPRYVAAVYGIGYRLAVDGAEASDGLGERGAAVLDALPDPLLVVDAGLRIRFANGAAERLLGADRGALVGRRCGELLDCRACDGRALDGPRCFGRAVLGGGGTLREEPAFVRAGTDLVPVVFSYGEVRLDGAEPLLAITVRPRAS